MQISMWFVHQIVVLLLGSFGNFLFSNQHTYTTVLQVLAELRAGLIFREMHGNAHPLICYPKAAEIISSGVVMCYVYAGDSASQLAASDGFKNMSSAERESIVKALLTSTLKAITFLEAVVRSTDLIFQNLVIVFMHALQICAAYHADIIPVCSWHWSAAKLSRTVPPARLVLMNSVLFCCLFAAARSLWRQTPSP